MNSLLMLTLGTQAMMHSGIQAKESFRPTTEIMIFLSTTVQLNTRAVFGTELVHTLFQTQCTAGMLDFIGAVFRVGIE